MSSDCKNDKGFNYFNGQWKEGRMEEFCRKSLNLKFKLPSG